MHQMWLFGVVLFHYYINSSEKPTTNDSKTLKDTQRKYGHLQKEAFLIIFALHYFINIYMVENLILLPTIVNYYLY